MIRHAFLAAGVALAVCAAGAPAAALVPASRAAPAQAAPTPAALAAGAAAGATGAAVLALQRRLAALGYWTGAADGRFGGYTTQAVYALQKAAGLPRDGVVGPRTWAALDRGALPRPYTASGRRAEIDLARQLLVLADGGRVRQVFNTSTGTGRLYTVGGVTKRAVTPRGTFRVQRQVNGWDRGPLGLLYRPRYFNGGIAVHGYASVPPYPASHGCVRVSTGAMDWLWASGWLKVGDTVVVH
ncbi:L,D-transpeptidase family protein [Actinomadura sp. ATCC 31491]|uniref:L,D-transpeptidase family protein n=1 Tax=Actinomadura luzonensis TaxID=2805427 RepID=A0ABT0FVD6_9ACTN|nr:L,D-transpeptidase family protein [Actinomadura luzonensis]MCK2216294.1 L,D-transpeptidase family protein [Actinomadura luzonensis]